MHPRRRLLALSFAFGACASAPAPAAAPASPPTAAPAGGACQVREGKDASMLTCASEHAVVIAPGTGWKLEDAAAPVFLHASNGPFQVSLRAAPASETQYPVDEHLRAVYQGIAEGPASGPGHVGPQRMAQTSHGRQVIVYEVEGLEDGGRPLRSIHVWSALRGPDRSYVDYHSSWTGPANDPELTQTPEHAPLPERLVNYADGFVTLDDAGHAAPQ